MLKFPTVSFETAIERRKFSQVTLPDRAFPTKTNHSCKKKEACTTAGFGQMTFLASTINFARGRSGELTPLLLGTLSYDDDDDNNNVIKQLVL